MKRRAVYPYRLSDLAPAPGDLAIIQALVNTADLEHGTDELDSPRALTGWLARQGLAAVGLEVSKADLERTIEVRVALRALLAANTRNGAADREAVARLDLEASRAPVVVRLSGGGATHFEPCSGGFDGVLGRLFAIVAAARLEDLWPRLKACANEGCGAVFWDASRNRCGKWCSTRRCGNRFHSRRSQRRQRRERKQQWKEAELRHRPPTQARGEGAA